MRTWNNVFLVSVLPPKEAVFIQMGVLGDFIMFGVSLSVMLH